jgi:hypothetical protein
MSAPRLKLAVLVNMIAPSRIPVYSVLAERFDLVLLHGGTESNRDSWRDLDKIAAQRANHKGLGLADFGLPTLEDDHEDPLSAAITATLPVENRRRNQINRPSREFLHWGRINGSLPSPSHAVWSPGRTNSGAHDDPVHVRWVDFLMAAGRR